MKARVCIFALLGAVLSVSAGGYGKAAPVVTADLQSLEATADAPLMVFLRPTPRGGEFSFGFRNDSAGGLTATLRLTGVPFDAMDIYNAGAFMGSYTREQLAAGVPVKMSGGLLPADQRAVVELHETLLEEMNRTLSLNERRTVAGARMLGLREMTRAIMVADRADRSARLILVESGRPTSRRATATPANREMLLQQVRELLADVERVRQFLETSGMDAAERARYHGWLVPLEVRAERSGPETLRISAVNRGALPVRGTLTLSAAGDGSQGVDLQLDVPPGRKVDIAAPLKRGSASTLPARLNGKAGEFAFSRSFELTPSSGG
ncbi:MAG: hypothetical protein WHZ52_07220 [Armatimonadota bacterium]